MLPHRVKACDKVNSNMIRFLKGKDSEENFNNSNFYDSLTISPVTLISCKKLKGSDNKLEP